MLEHNYSKSTPIKFKFSLNTSFSRSSSHWISPHFFYTTMYQFLFKTKTYHWVEHHYISVSEQLNNKVFSNGFLLRWKTIGCWWSEGLDSTQRKARPPRTQLTEADAEIKFSCFLFEFVKFSDHKPLKWPRSRERQCLMSQKYFCSVICVFISIWWVFEFNLYWPFNIIPETSFNFRFDKWARRCCCQ